LYKTIKRQYFEKINCSDGIVWLGNRYKWWG